MRLKRLCWHGSPHHPIHFSCVIALFFFRFPAFDACESISLLWKINAATSTLFSFSSAVYFVGLIVCWRKNNDTGFVFCFFSWALEVFWYYLHDGQVYVCVCVSWMARVIVQVGKKTQHRTWLYPVAGDDKVTSSVINVKSCNNSKHTNVITLANDTFKKTKPEKNRKWFHCRKSPVALNFDVLNIKTYWAFYCSIDLPVHINPLGDV